VNGGDPVDTEQKTEAFSFTLRFFEKKKGLIFGLSVKVT